jgi:hypothetical protein
MGVGKLESIGPILAALHAMNVLDDNEIQTVNLSLKK